MSVATMSALKNTIKNKCSNSASSLVLILKWFKVEQSFTCTGRLRVELRNSGFSKLCTYVI